MNDTTNTPEVPTITNTVIMDRGNKKAGIAPKQVGTMGIYNAPALAEVLDSGSPVEKAMLVKAVELGTSGVIRNHIAAERGTDFPDFASIIQANEIAAANRGGSAEALATNRLAIKSLLDVTAASGRSAGAVATLKQLVSSTAGLSNASELIRNKVLAYVLSWCDSISDEELATYETTITRLCTACEGNAIEADDF